MLWRMGAAIELSLAEKPASAEAAVASSILAQQHQATRALHEHAHRGLVARALDEVALPVPRHDAVVDLGRPHVAAHPLEDLGASIIAARARHASAAPVAQAGDELAAQLAPGLGVDGRVDRLVRDAALD